MRSNKVQFFSLLCFLIGTVLVVSNGFVERIFAEPEQVDVFSAIEPIGDVVDKILREYVQEPDLDRVVEGALVGMMNSLDDHSSYISPEDYRLIMEDTKGEFSGIGILIKLDEEKNIVVGAPLLGSPAEKAGLQPGDIIVEVDKASTKGMSLSEVQRRIKGPVGQVVKLKLFRRFEPDLSKPGEERRPELLDVEVRREKIPIESISEARMLPDGIGYIRLIDFKDKTSVELAAKIKEMEGKGMRSLILDLRGNPGGLLTASKQVSELFLPKNTLVTYTQGRKHPDGTVSESLKLFTEKDPVVPETFPVVLLVNEHTASSAEIVTGALEFWKRALVVGQKTYGKGSVQTIIQLARPANSALRLTTALYYTPAQVTIDKEGIKPDVDVPMPWMPLVYQLRESFIENPNNRDSQNHGAITGDPKTDKSVDDLQLQKAVDLLREDPLFDNLIKKYHKDTHETQVAAAPDATAKNAPAASGQSANQDERIKEPANAP